MNRQRWIIWSIACIAWVFVLPSIFGLWLAHEVDAQFTAGVRTSSDGDSIAIPIAGVAVLNFALVLAINVVLALYFLFRRYSTRGSNGPSSAADEPEH